MDMSAAKIEGTWERRKYLIGTHEESCNNLRYLSTETFDSQLTAIAAFVITEILNGPLTAAPQVATIHVQLERYIRSKLADNSRTDPSLMLSLRIPGRFSGSLKTNPCDMA